MCVGMCVGVCACGCMWACVHMCMYGCFWLSLGTLFGINTDHDETSGSHGDQGLAKHEQNMSSCLSFVVIRKLILG